MPSHKRKLPPQKDPQKAIGPKGGDRVGENGGDEQEAALVTPHIQRLLKLIQEGTASHAQLAASHLTILTANGSPLLLWDILGRLQAFLIANTWSCRQQASWAMQGVARHLPPNDQTKFLQNVQVVTGGSGGDGDDDDDDAGGRDGEVLWLTTDDVLKHFETIMRQGRLLMAMAETDNKHRKGGFYNESDDAELEQMDEQQRGTEHFVEQRIRWQRRVLAKRLGLSRLVDAIGGSHELLPKTITNDDLLGSERDETLAQSPDKQPHKQQQQKDPSIRALLVMEMKQQQEQSLSHHKPQTLLATELLYRMFDHRWEFRHGALLGILSLLKAWKKTSEGNGYSGQAFGSWPHDLLARCLCILGLDRFGDYGDGLVAPVREMASQAIAVLYRMAPTNVQLNVRRILHQLCELKGDWEARHGAMLALPYLLTIPDLPNDVCMEFTERAIKCLSDESDDVKSAAAKALSMVVQQQQEQQQPPNGYQDLIVRGAVVAVWKALSSEQGNTLFCGSNMVEFFAKVVCFDCDRVFEVLSVSFGSLLEKLLELSSFPSSDIKRSTFESIGSLLQSKSMTNLAKFNNSNNVICSLSKLVVALFDSFWSLDSWVDDPKVKGRLCSSRDRVWERVINCAGQLLVRNDTLRNELVLSLILKYAGLQNGDNSVNMTNLTTLLQASEALAKLLSVLAVGSTLRQVDVSIKILCMSPFRHHFESSALLVRSIGQLPEHSITAVLPLAFGLLINMIQHKDVPFCVCGEGRVCDDVQLATLYRKTLQQSLRHTIVAKSQSALADITALNSSFVSAAGGNRTADDVLSMRVSSRIAGTIVAGGRECLTSKLTPLIRPLMTALKSETYPDRARLVCIDIARLLTLLSAPSFLHVRDKLLANVCKLVATSTMEDERIQVQSASSVIKLFVSAHPQDENFVSIRPIWDVIGPFISDPSSKGEYSLCGSLRFMLAVFSALSQGKAAANLIRQCMPSVIAVACRSTEQSNREQALEGVRTLCRVDSKECIEHSIPLLVTSLSSRETTPIRIGASRVLYAVVNTAEMAICPYVKYLLPIAMSLMTDPVEICAREAATLFAVLVRVAPFVGDTAATGWEFGPDDHSDAVIEHLVRGKALPLCSLPDTIELELEHGGIKLRGYQQEGVSWLAFLRSVNLNGALCDEMGLGKTLQALVALALAHSKEEQGGSSTAVRSLVVCPSTLVGHWISEIAKYFPLKKLLLGLALTGNPKQRKDKWHKKISESNVVVTSYSVLRSEASNLLADEEFCYCILDEGHLLKNPKTATAMAAREIKAKHKLILTGTPVQNRVSELWATFDFLMPNFLGSHASFSRLYGNVIGKGQQPGAKPDAIARGMEKLKSLHQQVLPFILRREKHQVLTDLPPKCITDVPCELSPSQEALYKGFCNGSEAQQALAALQKGLGCTHDGTRPEPSALIGSNFLRSLMYLRLICTHPAMVEERVGTAFQSVGSSELKRSGKLLVLRDLLRTAGICAEDLTAADNDSSVFFVNDEGAESTDEADEILSGGDTGDTSDVKEPIESSRTATKCLIFAQFTQSLDVVEKYLFEPHMPSLRFLRLDGGVPFDKRADIVSTFNNDDSIKVMLLTTRVGGLGLNLTGASKVIFLEHDYNPHADLQAMDRAHRIGQTRAVDIYRLITTNTVEEKIMALQRTKLRMSEAIVNSENSSMYSMGTDKLLDIFTFNTGKEDSGSKARKRSKTDISHMDAFYEDDYESLSVENFLKG